MPTINDATVVASAYDTSGNGGRKLIRLSNGNLIAVVKNGTTGYKLYNSTDNGQNFTLLRDQVITSFSDVSIVAIGNKVGLLYNNGTNAVGFAVVDTNNVATNGTNVETGQTAIGNVSLAINDVGTGGWGVWSSKNATYPNSFNIRSAQFTINGDGSVTWGAVQQLTTYSTTGTDINNPSIVLFNNIPIIFADEVSGGSYTIGSYKWNGTTFPRLTVYSGGTYAQSSPSAIFVPQSINGLANGRIWVAWHGKDSVDTLGFNLRVSYSDDGGVTWSSMQKLTSGNANDLGFPSTTANKNNKIFILFQNTSSYGIKKISFDGASWSSVLDVTGSYSPLYPSALYDPTFNFTEPLFIYKNSQKVGFYGAWTITTISVTQGSIGTKSDKSNVLTYVVTTDGTMSTITEKVNGVAVGTKTATSGQSLIAGLTQTQWDAIKYGKYKDVTGGLNTLTVEMGIDIWTYTFDKRLATSDDISSAIKSVQDSQSTFLPSVKSKLASAVRGKGGTVNDTDAWDTIKTAIDTLGSLGSKKIANGTVTSDASNSNFIKKLGSASSYPSLTFSGLSFKAGYIFLINTTNNTFTVYSKTAFSTNANIILVESSTSDTPTTTQYRLDGAIAYISGTGFKLPVGYNSASFTWIAIEE